MKYLMFLRHCAVALAALGIVLPTQALRAEQPLAGAPQQQPVAIEIPDVALGNGGLLHGVVVDEQGRALANSPVAVRQGTNELVRTATNKEGRFAVIGLKGGVYQVATDQGSMNARLWNEGSAPPAAKDSLMLVNGQQMALGQSPGFCPNLGWTEVLIFTGVIAAAIAIPLALNNDNDNNS